MDVAIPPGTGTETRVSSAGEQPAPNATDPQPMAADNNVSQVRKPPASRLTKAAQDSLSTEEMLKLMEESDREATMAVTNQQGTASSGSLFKETSVEEPVNNLGGQTKPKSPKKLIALLVPLTGRGASLGEAMLNAAEMALFDTFDETSR